MSSPKPAVTPSLPVGAPTAPQSTNAAPRITRIATLRAMLARPDGARLDALCASTGWQKHSVRAALSGLRQSGVKLDRCSAEGPGGPVYRIVDAGTAPTAGASQ